MSASDTPRSSVGRGPRTPSSAAAAKPAAAKPAPAKPASAKTGGGKPSAATPATAAAGGASAAGATRVAGVPASARPDAASASPAERSAAEPTEVIPTVPSAGQQPSQARAGQQPSQAPPGQPTAVVTAIPADRAQAAMAGRRSRRARLVLARVDPWSVMKLSFLLSIALAVVTLVAVFVIWSVLDGMGVFAAASSTIADVTQGEQGGAFDLMSYIGLSRVLGVATMLACVNVLLITALATLGAFLYNLATSLVGGLHVTLSEDL